MKISIHTFIEIVITTLKEIESPRFFKTEGSFQGRFTIALNKILGEQNIFPDDTIIEEEYQKRLKLHGIKQRDFFLGYLKETCAKTFLSLVPIPDMSIFD